MQRIVSSSVVLSFLLFSIFINPATANAYSFIDLKQQVTGAKSAITNTVNDTVTNVSPDISDKVLQASQTAMGKADYIRAKVGNLADQAVDKAGVVGSKTLEFSRTAIETTEAGSVAAAKEAAVLAKQAVDEVRSASIAVADRISDSFERYAQPLLETAIEQIDLAQIMTTVNQIRQEASDSKAEILVKHLINQKVVQAANTDNWLEIARLQAEMIYEIAAVHGFLPDDKDRRQEVLDIAGANLGRNKLLGNSLPLLKYGVGFVPGGNLASIAIDAGGDRMIRLLMFPILGNSACKHYTLQAAEPKSTAQTAIDTVVSSAVLTVTP